MDLRYMKGQAMRTRAEAAAYRRAMTALDHLADEIDILGKRIGDDCADGDDTQRIASLTRDLVQQVSVLGALRESREQGSQIDSLVRQENTEFDTSCQICGDPRGH
jgi:hypothetical protein